MDSSQSAADEYLGAHRLVPISPDNHSGYIWVATILSLIYTILTAAVRIVVKWRMYGLDDYLLFFAVLTHLGQVTAVFYGLRHGLGISNSTTTADQWSTSGQAFFASELLTLVILSLAKCSTAALILRVFTANGDQGRRWVTCLLYLGVSAAWGLGSVLGLSVDCDASTILTTRNTVQCPKQVLRWQAITAVDVTTDVLACALPVMMTWPLRMPAAVKVQVAAAFLFRAPLAAVSGVHLGLLGAYPGAAEPQLAVAEAVILQQVMVAWAAASATIPNLRGFMKAFHTGLGTAAGFRTMADQRGTDAGAYPLQAIGDAPSRTKGSRTSGVPTATLGTRTTLGTRDREGDGPGSGERSHPRFRPDPCGHEATVSHSDDTSATTDEGESLRCGSRELIIRKQVDWEVYHEPR